LFSDADRRAIADAVRAAERTTTGEIVPVVASTSDHYERAEDFAGLAVAGLALSLAWLLGQRLVPGVDWDAEHELALQLPLLLAVLVAGWFLGVLLARFSPWLKRLFLLRRVAKARVLIAAHHAFDALAVKRTAAATGVVIYVSLFERQVCVCADRAVAQRIGEAEWARACTMLIEGLRRGQPREGFVAAIQHVGTVLAANFPAVPGDRNELSNELRVLD
jgi:putative membrane protein